LFHLNPSNEGYGAQPVDGNLDGIAGNGGVSQDWKGEDDDPDCFRIAQFLERVRYFSLY
jgi:hypothetical protein